MTREELQIEMQKMTIQTDQISPLFKKPAGTLKINNNISFQLYDEKLPCRFHRWMARILLGWKYEVYK